MSEADILKQVMSGTNIAKIPAGQVMAKFIEKITSQQQADVELRTNTGALVSVKPRIGFESAETVPDQSIREKIFPMYWSGTLEQFANGEATVWTSSTSVDHNLADAKLVELGGNVQLVQSDFDFQLGVCVEDGTTNTEFLVGSDFSSKKAPKEITFVIPAKAPVLTKVNVSLYKRQQEVDWDEISNYVGFQFSSLADDIVEHDPTSCVTYLRHTAENPSPIILVLEKGKIDEVYNPEDMHEVTTKSGVDSVAVSTHDVKWSLEHIRQGYDSMQFANLANIKATLVPLTRDAKWELSREATKGGASLHSKHTDVSLQSLNNLFGSSKIYTVQAYVKKEYVVCNNVQDAVANAMKELGDY